MFDFPLEIATIIAEYNGIYPNIKINKKFYEIYHNVSKKYVNKTNIFKCDSITFIYWIVHKNKEKICCYKILCNAYMKGFTNILRLLSTYDDDNQNYEYIFKIFLYKKSIKKETENFIIRLLFNKYKYAQSTEYYYSDKCEIIYNNNLPLSPKILHIALENNDHKVIKYFEKYYIQNLELKFLKFDLLDNYLTYVYEHDTKNFLNLLNYLKNQVDFPTKRLIVNKWN